MTAPKKIRVGDLLVEHGLITEDQLKAGLAEQKKTGKRIGRILVELEFVDEIRLLSLLSQQLHIPFIDLKNHTFQPQLLNRLSEAHARRFRAMVLSEKNDQLVVGMSDPTDIFAFDELSRLLGGSFQQAFVRETDLLDAMDRVYRRTTDIQELAGELEGELIDDAFDFSDLDEAGDEGDAVVVRLLNFIFEDALQVGASDIHIEPDQNLIRVRNRVDGVLQENVLKEKRINQALVLRLKLMSGLNISEKRMPQDGRFHIKVKNKPIDVRLSTMPTQHGESVVMRILDASRGIGSLDQVGMPENMLKRFRAMVQSPHGLILVTGPTGSGKTTTLYAALQERNSPATKIITCEDPVEYQLPRIQQVQINSKIGLTFATVLRSTLRQDPDVLLVGEIRDQETAEIALRASMTGHLVLSTLHTNDVLSSAMRLIDMGVKGYLAASSLRCVVAQRLVRRICENCTVEHLMTPQEHAWLVQGYGEQQANQLQFKKGMGCGQCHNTGFLGRIGAFEYLEIDEPMAEALRKGDTGAFTRAARSSSQYMPLLHCAMGYAMIGLTTLGEVMRVCEQVDESRPDTISKSPSPAAENTTVTADHPQELPHEAGG